MTQQLKGKGIRLTPSQQVQHKEHKPDQGPQPAPVWEWHRIPADSVLEHLGVAVEQGLTTQDVTARRAQYGSNELIERAARSPLMLLWDQMTEPLVIILLVAAGISAALGKVEELIAIIAIVALNAILGVVQEYRAEKAIAALKKMSQPMVTVRRNGEVCQVEATELVPGDVALLEAGNIVPADARIIVAANLRVQEASLTGESYAVDKQSGVLDADNMPLGDRRNMLYMGTSVAYGRGVAVITETGMMTELGRIADMIQSVGGEKSPLQRRMGELGRILFGAAFVVMVAAFVVGWLTGQTFDEVLLSAVAIAVAVVPEGLPAVVTISLALGAQRMLRRRALIRKLPAVETLGSVTVIASDKTGTLTENRMAMKVIDVAGDTLSTTEAIQSGQTHTAPIHSGEVLTLIGAALCNDSSLRADPNRPSQPTIIGDPTEGAMVVAAQTYGLDKSQLDAWLPRVHEAPFSSERKRMTTIHAINPDNLKNGPALRVLSGLADEYIAFTKGAPDGLLAISTHIYNDGQVLPLDDEWRQRIETANNTLAGEGLRVLALAYRSLAAVPEGDPIHVEADMVFVGLMGMIDPPRQEVKEAVAISKQAGIRPVMITGDHPMTAQAIAMQIGITEMGSQVLTGQELALMSDAELRQQVDVVSVYARVSPEHKLRIVRALQDSGQVVAMTGDGVNDAPALKQANIGVAMGITGTDVSKQASDMVITDDNFATIVHAAEEGRAIYDNVRRFVKYLLASNTGELFVLLAMQLVAGMTMPLTTLQILWMNLITDGVPALALGVEQREPNAMQRPPVAPNESVLGRGLGRHILLIGGTLGLLALILGVVAFNMDLRAANGAPAWNTMVFMVLTMAQMGHALGLRSHTRSLFSMNFFSNPILLVAVTATLFLQLIAVYSPFFNDLFGTNPLTLSQLLICLALSTVVFVVVELEKLLIRRGVFKA